MSRLVIVASDSAGLVTAAAIATADPLKDWLIQVGEDSDFTLTESVTLPTNALFSADSSCTIEVPAGVIMTLQPGLYDVPNGNLGSVFTGDGVVRVAEVVEAIPTRTIAVGIAPAQIAIAATIGTEATPGELRTLDVDDGTLVHAEGYFTSYDGGEGFFIYRDAPLWTADNGYSIAVSGKSGRFERTKKGRYSVDVTEYGAIPGKSYAQQTGGIKEAVEKAVAIGAEQLYFPDGIYQINEAIAIPHNTVGLSIRGQSVLRTQIWAMAEMDAIISMDTGYGDGLAGWADDVTTSYRWATIENLDMYGANKATSCLLLRGVYQCTIGRMNLRYAKEYGLLLDDYAIGNDFNGMECRNCGLGGMKAQGPVGVNTNTFRSCYFQFNGTPAGTPLHASGPGIYWIGNNHYGNSFERCRVETNLYGVVFRQDEVNGPMKSFHIKGGYWANWLYDFDFMGYNANKTPNITIEEAFIGPSGGGGPSGSSGVWARFANMGEGYCRYNLGGSKWGVDTYGNSDDFDLSHNDYVVVNALAEDPYPAP